MGFWIGYVTRGVDDCSSDIDHILDFDEPVVWISWFERSDDTGLRFVNVEVPEGVTIIDATLTLFNPDPVPIYHEEEPPGWTPEILDRVWGFWQANCQSLEGLSLAELRGLTRTIHYCDGEWDDPSDPQYRWRLSFDTLERKFLDITQELIDLPGWQLGNAMGFYFSDRLAQPTQEMSSCEGGRPARLYIAWEQPPPVDPPPTPPENLWQVCWYTFLHEQWYRCIEVHKPTLDNCPGMGFYWREYWEAVGRPAEKPGIRIPGENPVYTWELT